MDPLATLQRAFDALSSGDWDEVIEAVRDYKAWRKRGGFKPDSREIRGIKLEFLPNADDLADDMAKWARSRMKIARSSPERARRNPAKVGRKIAEFGNVKVYYSSEWKEYQVQTGKPSETYFTTDKEDALSTAQAIDARRSGAAVRKMNPKRKRNPIPKQLREFALKHKLSIRREEFHDGTVYTYLESGKPVHHSSTPNGMLAWLKRHAVPKKAETMEIVSARPLKKSRKKNPTVKGAYWLYWRPTGKGWQKLSERPTLALAKRAAQQVANRTGRQVKILLGRP